MNNKPVAWMDEINTFVLDKDYQQFPKSLQNGMIPLYTHPVKELTDEEITGAVARGWCSEKNSMKVMDSDLAWAIVEEIRAILRKASEK